MKKYLFMVLLSLAISATACGKSAEEPKVDIAEVNTTESEEVATENLDFENENSTNFDGENDATEPVSNIEKEYELLGITYIEDDEYELEDFTVWDGTGEWKRDSAYQFSMEQYYDGKYYAVDWISGAVEGEEFPMGVNPTYFLFCEDMFFYMEDDRTASGPASEVSNELYVYSFKTGEARLLVTQVRKAAYEQGKIIYEHYSEDYRDLVIGRVDVETGEKEYEKTIPRGDCTYLSNRYIEFYSGGPHTYNLENDTVKKLFIPKECYWVETIKGNTYGYFDTDDGKHCVELYEQGERVSRIFPQIIGEEPEICDDKIYYLKDGIAKEYCLATLELKDICEASTEKNGKNILARVYKAGDAIITVEDEKDERDELGDPVMHRYAIDDTGVKKKIY